MLKSSSKFTEFLCVLCASFALSASRKIDTQIPKLRDAKKREVRQVLHLLNRNPFENQMSIIDKFSLAAYSL
jgi:hypothetical protein